MNQLESSIVQQNGAALLAAVGILPSNVQPLTRNAFVDRELIMSVSDGFTRQTWVIDGRVIRETRETLSFVDDEVVRITVANDTLGVRVITVGDGRMLRLSAGQSGSIDVVSRRGVEFAIAVVGQPAFSRLVMVRDKADARVRAA
jgi:RNase P/RNase MRP subunit p29